MTHLEFSPYHNRYIKFQKKDGTIHYGVVVDTINPTKKAHGWEYTYIPKENMKKWKDAERARRYAAMAALEQKVDIRNITKAWKLPVD